MEIYKGEIKGQQSKQTVTFENAPLSADAISAFFIQKDERSASCYLDQTEDRGCTVALNNSWLICFALSFIHLLACHIYHHNLLPGQGKN